MNTKKLSNLLKFGSTKYDYSNSLKKDLFERSAELSSQPSSILHEMALLSVDAGGLDALVADLNVLKNDEEEVIVAYDRFGALPKKGLVGSYFIRGHISKATPNNIEFIGPESKTTAGMTYSGSPFDLQPGYVHDVFLVHGYTSNKRNALHAYQFAPLYCEDLGSSGMPLIVAKDSVEAFTLLCEHLPSLKSDMETGYTTPMKLVAISKLPREVRAVYATSRKASSLTNDTSTMGLGHSGMGG
jgi:hypothetical protein